MSLQALLTVVVAVGFTLLVYRVFHPANREHFEAMGHIPITDYKRGAQRKNQGLGNTSPSPADADSAGADSAEADSAAADKGAANS